MRLPLATLGTSMIIGLGLMGAASADPGEVLWRFDVSNVSGAFVSIGVDGTIYTADNDRLWALNPDGTVRWTFEDSGGGISAAGGGSPVAVLPDGRIVTAAGHTIWALNPDGSVSWSYSWDGGYNNQIDNGPSVGPDGHIYATTAVNNGDGLGVFSLTADGDLRWSDEPDPPLLIINASHGQRVRFTDDRLVFGFVATTGAPSIYAYDLDGSQTNYVNYTCTSAPNTDPLGRLLLAGVCGLQAIDLDSDSIVWNVGLGPVNMLPIAGADGTVYSGSWHGPVSAISPEGEIQWTSEPVGLQRTLAVDEAHNQFLYCGETFGQPNWFGAVDTRTGASMWQIPMQNVDGHNELSWSNEAALSPDGAVAYFTTRFTSNGAPGRVYAVRIAESPCPADLDGDGAVGGADLAALLAAWGANAGSPADLDDSGHVNAADLAIMLGAWGPC